MHRRVRRYAALVIAPMTLTAVVLIAAGPVQASAAPVGGHALTARGTTKTMAGQAAVAKRAAAKAALPGDVRRVCAAPKRGFAACMALVRTNVPAHKGLFTHDTTPSGYGPSDLQSAYNLPSATAGAGQTVAIVDAYDNPNAAADLATYRAQYGLPACTTASGCFEKVNQQGQQGSYPPPDSGWALEESLDVDMVSAVCPACHIILVEANSNSNADLYAAEDEAVALGAKYVSNSWGESEYSSELQDDQYFNHPGVVITAASGDSGYLSRGTANWPASSPYVTSVGGTSLTRDSSTTRGWAETAWTGGGSGCSLYEPKPAWQHDPGCANRMTTDVSAVADPNTGVALYDSGAGGWVVVGGTSVATPVIASTYALAGTPQAGTYPSSYPYFHSPNGLTTPAGLNDVTAGSNGTCTPAYFCTAGPGYDGPTGLGTPDGTAAFTPVPTGTVAGTVTGASSGQPIAGATVAVGGFTLKTDASGQYSIPVPAGSYTVTAGDYGYVTQSASGVQVTQGQTVTQSFALTAAPTVTLSGKVTDGSGHGWPLPVKITVPGTPLAAVYTSPSTGSYSLSLPAQAAYTLHVAPEYPGYAARNVTVQVGASNTAKNIPVRVASSGCAAPGYAYTGTGASFVGWTGFTPQDGWSVTDNNGSGYTWAFGNATGEGQPPGGGSGFAIADSNYWNTSPIDTSLVSPVANLSGVSAPVIAFDTWYRAIRGQSAQVDLSLDGGKTWATVWKQTTTTVEGPVSIPIPQAAGQSGVRVKFRYTTGTTANDWWWSLANVFIGATTCSVTPGGLVAGTVTAASSGAPLGGATVAVKASPREQGTSAAAPADPALPGGFYWLFAGTGSQQFTAADGGYATAGAAVSVRAGSVIKLGWALKAGQLTETGASITASEALGQSATADVRFANNGTAPARVTLSPAAPGFTPTGGQDTARPRGAPPRQIKVKLGRRFTLAEFQDLEAAVAAGARSRAAGGEAAPGGSSWANIADYPIQIKYNAVAYDPRTGKVYSVGGDTYEPGVSSNNYPAVENGYVYDPSHPGAWSPIASLPQPRVGAAAAFVGGRMYIVGGGAVGYGLNGANHYAGEVTPTASVEVYDPSSNSWSQAAPLPRPIGVSPGAAVLGGQLYIVGGCPGYGDVRCESSDEPFQPVSTSGFSRSVYRYDPAANTWTQLASYPIPAEWASCAGIDGEVVCAGGVVGGPADQHFSKSTYIYDPVSNTWSRGASMPRYNILTEVVAGANGRLQIVGGGTFLHGQSYFTNQGQEYDPVSNSWSALPNANFPEIFGSGSCGLYQVGGGSSIVGENLTFADTLPGYDRCGPVSVPWLQAGKTSFTVPAGQSVTVPMTLDSSRVTQPGTYTAGLTVGADTPQQVPPVTVTLTVNPPKTWGEITGTVTSASTGKPIAGATVVIGTLGGSGQVSYTTTTESSGHYQWWLDDRYDPLLVSVAKDGYQPQAHKVSLTAGQATTLNFTLAANPNPTGDKR